MLNIMDLCLVIKVFFLNLLWEISIRNSLWRPTGKARYPDLGRSLAARAEVLFSIYVLWLLMMMMDRYDVSHNTT